mgnify:CR=1
MEALTDGQLEKWRMNHEQPDQMNNTDEVEQRGSLSFLFSLYSHFLFNLFSLNKTFVLPRLSPSL